MPRKSIQKVERKQYRVFWFVPNIIGYVRLLSVFSFCLFDARGNYHLAAGFYLLCVVLDLFDGMLARKLNQCSKFGEFLDVFVDNCARSSLWIAVVCHSSRENSFLRPLLILPLILEWTCFISTHKPSDGSRNWKYAGDQKYPWFIEKIFENGFKNPFGGVAIAGSFFLPLALYCGFLELSIARPTSLVASLSDQSYAMAVCVLILGRCICACAELYIIASHCISLLPRDAPS